MADSGRITLTLYSRSWCHLCDDMLAGLRVLQARQPFGLNIVDVDSQPALERRFGEFVPVLMHGERELCHYHLDAAAVTDYLRDFR
ncbi:MAG: glutaredoxin family protein [Burkholderiales bacterium]|nr:glutaredoxin family protein [Burkholderiales bacterium]